jgi:hypothetical protein
MAPSSTYTKVSSVDYHDIADHDEKYDAEDPTSFSKPLLEEDNTSKSTCSPRRFAGSAGGRSSRWRGCCMTFCLIATIVLSVLVAISVGMAIAGYMWMAQQVEQWSVTTPNPNISISMIPESELQLFKDRASLFFDSIQSGKADSSVRKIDDLFVTARAMNGFIGHSDYLRGNMYTTVTPNSIVSDVSLPLEGKLPGGKGRYLVGMLSLDYDPTTNIIHDTFVPRSSDAKTLPSDVYWDMTYSLTSTPSSSASSSYETVDSKLNNGGRKYNLQILSGKFFGNTIPQDFIDQHQNLLDDLYDPDCTDDEDCMAMRKVLDSMVNILIEKDQIILQAEPVLSNKKRKCGGGHHNHRALRAVGSDEEAIATDASSSSSWKLKIARRLVGM